MIPLLLFGGILAERVRPGKDDSPRRLLVLGALLVTIGAYAILAEALAITVIVTGEANLPEEILTTLFLFGGMIAVVVALVHPWYAKLRDGEGNKDKKARLLGFGTVAALGSVAILVGLLLLFSLHQAGEGEFSEKRSAAITQKTTEEAAVRSRIVVLMIAVGRVEQQVKVALARQEDSVIVDGYEAELANLRARLSAERGNARVLTTAITGLKHAEYGTQEAG